MTTNKLISTPEIYAGRVDETDDQTDGRTDGTALHYQQEMEMAPLRYQSLNSDLLLAVMMRPSLKDAFRCDPMTKKWNAMPRRATSVDVVRQKNVRQNNRRQRKTIASRHNELKKKPLTFDLRLYTRNRQIYIVTAIFWLVGGPICSDRELLWISDACAGVAPSGERLRRKGKHSVMYR